MTLQDERWLITGANGKIGRGLRRHLQPRVGHLVVADLEAPEAGEANETCRAFDLRDPATIPPLLDGVDGVVHLAGIPDEAPYADLLQVNALGLYHLLESMRAAGVRHLVYASSNRATGLHPASATLDETSTIRPDGLYGASKAACEALARMYADKFGLRVASLRIGTFKEAPENPREAATWLSHADAWRAFEAAMTTREGFCVFYAVSANEHRFWSLEPGRAIGYEPQDDAARILGHDVAPPRDEPQAGALGSAEFTLRHM